MSNDKIKIWECPNCGWIISDDEMQTARYNYGCKYCGRSLGDFYPFDKKEETILEGEVQG
jgi:rubredoxin